MDKFLISRYEEQYAQQQLKIDSFLIQKMGLMQKHSFLKAGDYFLYAVPTKIGFNEAQLLLAMSEREKTMLEDIKDKPQQLRMRFNSPLFGKELGLFLKTHITNISQNIGRGNAVLVDLAFLTMPNDFKEIVIELFLLLEKLKERWSQHESEDIAIPIALFRQLSIETNTHLIIPEKGRFVCLFKSISLKSAELYISSTLIPKLPEVEGSLSLEILWGGGSFMVNAKLATEVKDTHQDKVKLLRLGLDFSPGLTDTLLPVIEMIREQRGADDTPSAGTPAGQQGDKPVETADRS